MDLMLDVVHHLLAAHEVPDAVTGENHPAVLVRINLQSADVWLG